MSAMNDFNMVEWARELLFRQIMKHPLPWRIDEDWTKEVIAADGACIAKFQTYAQAQEMIDAAEALRAYLIERTKKADEEIRALGYEELFECLSKCIGSDPTCPCNDGGLCHYVDGKDGTKAMTAGAHDLAHPDGPKCACGKPSYHESGACYDCYYWKQP